MKTYSEMYKFNTLKERYEYLKISSMIGIETFGNERHINQMFYNSPEWKNFRRRVIIRDGGNELGLEGYPITGNIYIHHINPITVDDVVERRPCVMDMDNVICVGLDMHNSIHFGNNFELLNLDKYNIVGRKPNDTCPWKQ